MKFSSTVTSSRRKTRKASGAQAMLMGARRRARERRRATRLQPKPLITDSGAAPAPGGAPGAPHLMRAD
jgi:hypothetical protein